MRGTWKSSTENGEGLLPVDDLARDWHVEV